MEKTIKISEQTHKLLKEFCKERGYKINGLVETLIKEKVEASKKPLPKNILPVNSKS